MLRKLKISGTFFVFIRRKRPGKKANTYTNEALSLDNIDIDHQYAEVKTKKPNKNKPLTPKLGNIKD